MDYNPEKVVRGQIPVHVVDDKPAYDPVEEGYWDPAAGFWIGNLKPQRVEKLEINPKILAVIIIFVILAMSFGWFVAELTMKYFGVRG